MRPVDTIDWVRKHSPAPLRHAGRGLYRRSGVGPLYRRAYLRFAGDERAVKLRYARVFGAPPDLVHPRTLSEKLQWRILYDRRPLLQVTCDKVAVREYVAARVGPQHLIPLLGVFADPADIPWGRTSRTVRYQGVAQQRLQPVCVRRGRGR